MLPWKQLVSKLLLNGRGKLTVMVVEETNSAHTGRQRETSTAVFQSRRERKYGLTHSCFSNM